MTIEVITHTELSSSAYITLSSIPNTYTDLYISLSCKGSSNPFVGMGFNGSVTGFTNRQLTGDSSSAGTSSRSDTFVGYGGYNVANTFASGSIYIPNYSGSSYKSFSIDLVSEGTGSTFQTITAGLWSNTSAISSIELYQWNTGNAKQDFVQYTSVTLYGITAGSDGTTAVS